MSNNKKAMMKFKIGTLILLTFLASCHRQTTDETLFAKVENVQPTNEVKNIEIETFPLDAIDSYYKGFMNICQNQILFIDEQLCYMFFFDENGKLINRKFGKGQGPSELMTSRIDGYAQLEPSGFFFVGASNDCHLYDSALQIQKRYVIDKGKREGTANYETPWIYTLSYGHLVMKNYGNKLYYTVFSEYQDMNFIDSPTSYFRNVHYLCQMDLETGKVEKMLGKYPPIYTQKETLKPFTFVDFDIDREGNFYVSFEADSLIYMYDKEFIPLKTFGYAGKRMKEPKRVLSTFSDFGEHYEEERAKNGYYTHIQYIDETGLLLRNYARGNEEKADGLQIYKNGVLLGDVDVPKNSHVIGYIPPFYYAAIDTDDESETITMYKFKLEPL